METSNIFKRVKDFSKGFLLQKFFIFVGIFFIVASMQSISPAGYMFVYSDGDCPAGTNDTGKVHHEVQSKSLLKLNVDGSAGGAWMEHNASMCLDWINSLGTACYTGSISVDNKICYQLITGAQDFYGSNGDWHRHYSCVTERVIYSTYRICKWDLP